jgi:hypothetical protein
LLFVSNFPVPARGASTRHHHRLYLVWAQASKTTAEAAWLSLCGPGGRSDGETDVAVLAAALQSALYTLPRYGSMYARAGLGVDGGGGGVGDGD